MTSSWILHRYLRTHAVFLFFLLRFHATGWIRYVNFVFPRFLCLKRCALFGQFRCVVRDYNWWASSFYLSRIQEAIRKANRPKVLPSWLAKFWTPWFIVEIYDNDSLNSTISCIFFTGIKHYHVKSTTNSTNFKNMRYFTFTWGKTNKRNV